ncbi:MAG TPA: DUF4426 domain-containing protein [Gammaproteobacteria bacterium]|nr:DUF4426 domain-containing protein [Gammaproteobacteria bacterium]
MRRTLATLGLALCTLALAASPAQAESFKDFGEYRVHYNAFTSDMLTPEVARNYDIQRSGYRAVLNIAVQEKTPEGYVPVAADVGASATNLNAQLRRLDVREIREDQAVYYIADFEVANEEVLDFDIRVRPKGEERTFGIRFRQQFFGPQ